MIAYKFLQIFTPIPSFIDKIKAVRWREPELLEIPATT
jgi:hypothetical protein